ncbi:MAG TPA: NADH-quinone oxidoreductase subunit NuoE [Spirochaetia bacterium]|nr:NADH-quinone oxidoreductase subunit NuoE [Spirochaetia bacterium]
MTTTDEKQKIEELKGFMAPLTEDTYAESHLIGILHKAQELFGYLPAKVMEEVALTMGIPTAKIWGVASFYHYFNLAPVGRHVLSVCLGTACYVKGADRILNQIREDLNITIGETTADGLFTLQEARCLGACGLAPVVMIDDKIHGNLTPESMSALITQIKNNASKGE